MTSVLNQINKKDLMFTLKHQGFIHIDGMFTHLTPYLQRTWKQGCLAMARELKISHPQFRQLFSAFSQQNTFVRQLVNLVESPMASLMTEISNVEKTPIDFSLFTKSSQSRGATHAHQDISYRWSRPQAAYTLTSWLAIDDADEASGALDFIPGSHLKEIEPEQDFLRKDFEDRRNTTKWKQQAKTPQVQAGDVLIFDSRIWHSAWPLTKNYERRALAIRWRDSAILKEIGIPKPAIKNNVFGMNTSGKLFVSAVCKCLKNSGLRPESSVENALSTLFEIHPQLDTKTWVILEDLQLSLQAQSTIGSRTNKEIWEAVRDDVIPQLSKIAPTPLQQGNFHDY